MKMAASALKIKALIAGNGDSMLISYPSGLKTVNILIDGGNGAENYKSHLRPILENIIAAGQKLDLVVITHIDQDHIKGILYLIRDMLSAKEAVKPEDITKYWFNGAAAKKVYSSGATSTDISANEMHELERFLHGQPNEKWDINDKVAFPSTRKLNGAIFTLLSPNLKVLGEFEKTYQPADISTSSDDYGHSIDALFAAECIKLEKSNEELDQKLENASSIAFLFEFSGISMLHLGDAIPNVIDEALEAVLQERKMERLEVDVVKLSHHASRKSISFRFLALVTCRRYLISANGKKAKLPNKATFSKILKHPSRNPKEHIEFFFNYPEFSKKLKFTDSEKESYNFSCHDANFAHGYCLSLTSKI